jgi:hypothetical protein
VNLAERYIEVHTSVRADSYARVEKFERGQVTRLGEFADVEVRVSDVLK